MAAFHTVISGDGSEEDDLFIPREKTTDELEREEEEYQGFLRREVGEDLRQLIEVDQDIIGIHETAPSGQGDDEGQKKQKKVKGKEKDKGRPKTKDEKEKGDQEFLMKFVLLTPLMLFSGVTLFFYSYILNRGWIDRSAKRLPTYTEVTSARNRKTRSKIEGPGDYGGGAAGSPGGSSDPESSGSDNMIEDEDEFDDVADVFESSFNFRFEEPYVAPAHSEWETGILGFTCLQECS